VSFKCDFCKQCSQPREKMRRIPVETRTKRYQYHHGEFFGTEIVREVQCCEKCWLDGIHVPVIQTAGELQVSYLQTPSAYIAHSNFR